MKKLFFHGYLLIFFLSSFVYGQTLDTTFRSTSPTDSEIIDTVIASMPALASCDKNAMNVVRVITNVPVVQTGESNTIYVFEAGTHTLPFTSNAGTWALVKGMTIMGKNCVGLVGDTSGGEVILTTTSFMQQGYPTHPDRPHGINYFTRGGMIEIENSQRIGIHGITIQGLVGGEKNHIGIAFKNVSNFHAENLLIENNLLAGMFFYDTKFGTIRNVTSRHHGNNNVYRSSVHARNMLWNRGFGIQMQDSHTITLTNVITSHSTVGFEIWGRYAKPHTIVWSGGASHSNRRLGIWLDDAINGVNLHNLDIYNNNNTITDRMGGGIHFKSREFDTVRPENITISNTRIFGHDGFGIQINGGSGVVINNSMIFNNGLGLTFAHDHPDQLRPGHKGYVTFANSVMTNNTTGINAPAPYNHELLIQNSLISHNTVGLVSGNPQTRTNGSVFLNNGSAIIATASLTLGSGTTLVNNTTSIVNAHLIIGSVSQILTGLTDLCALSVRPYESFNASCIQQGRITTDPNLVGSTQYRIGLHAPIQKAVTNYTQTTTLIPAPTQLTYIVGSLLLPSPTVAFSLLGGGIESLMTTIPHDSCNDLILDATATLSFPSTGPIYPLGDVRVQAGFGPRILFSRTSSFVGESLTESFTTTQPANTLGNGLYTTYLSLTYTYDPHGLSISQSGVINVANGLCAPPTPTQFYGCRLTDGNKPSSYVPVLHGSRPNSAFILTAINGDSSLARVFNYPFLNQPRGHIHTLRTTNPTATTFSIIDLAQGPSAPIQTVTVTPTTQRCLVNTNVITNPDFTQPPFSVSGQATIAELSTLHTITHTICKTPENYFRVVFDYPADYVVYTRIQKNTGGGFVDLLPSEYLITGHSITITGVPLGGSRPRIRVQYKNRPGGTTISALSHSGGLPISTPCP
ncbi:MAG: right-handed parallel beta-helix repeat-containing protein [Candidatus Absconditabacterales bacterium]|nr:right-handed parallel beta-helix repeat-containing protein [Candidatus Absconditabacterales bacterium]